MKRTLSYSQMPRLDVPLRFMLGAPWMGMLASVLLACWPAALLQSRFSGAALAATHLLALGFLAACMLGALLQILPVVCGVLLPQSARWAALIHPALLLGTLALAAGFLWPHPLLFILAPALLALAFLPFLLLAASGLARAPGGESSASSRAIKLALLGLAFTVALGLGMALSLGNVLGPLPLLRLTAVHLGWGGAGWIVMLVMGVAFQVIPMFQATPPYPERYARLAPPLLFGLLCLTFFDVAPMTALALQLALAGVVASFALQTLWLLAHRKRARPDPTTLFWRLAMLGLLACVLALLCGEELLAGGLFFLGFAVPATSGMLLKIVPFLAWYHAQDSAPIGSGKKPPSITAYLDEGSAKRQFALYALAVALFVAAALAWRAGLEAPALVAARLSGTALALAFAWLGWNLLGAARLYRRATRALAAA